MFNSIILTNLESPETNAGQTFNCNLNLILLYFIA